MTCRVFVFVYLTTLFIILVGSPVFAAVQDLQDLGVTGETYPVVEPDILVQLRADARQHQPTREEILQKVKTYQPHNLQPLSRASRDRTFPVDMTYTFKKDIVDVKGNIIYPRGYTFNPLDYYTFHGGMVVIDGSDPDQVKWFEKSPYFNNHQARLLLSGGYAYDLVKQYKRPVFYLTDIIARRLQLAAVPAVIVQQGKKLQVREVYIPPVSREKEKGVPRE